MKFRINEWHRRNPGQLGASQYMFRTTLRSFPATRIACANHYSDSSHFRHPKTSNLRLTVEDHIASLERELFELQSRYQITGIPPHVHSEEIWPSSIGPDSPELATQPTLLESKLLPSYSLSDATAKFQVSKPLHQHAVSYTPPRILMDSIRSPGKLLILCLDS